LPKKAATGKSPANLIAGSSAVFFSSDPVHALGLGLAIEASDLHKARGKQQATQNKKHLSRAGKTAPSRHRRNIRNSRSLETIVL
jgi:hypothetical protein